MTSPLLDIGASGGGLCVTRAASRLRRDAHTRNTFAAMAAAHISALYYYVG